MKNFFTTLLASILGVILASLIMFFIFLGVISAIVSRQEKPINIKSNTVLVLPLDRPVVDRKSNLPILNVGLQNLGVGMQIGLNDILNVISNAKSDSNISGIYLELSDLEAGTATIEEIRNALLDFRESGKFVVAFSDTYSQAAYYLASASDKIFMNPTGYIEFVGLSAQVMFYRETLEKLEIEPEITRHGEFKSAVEPFMYDHMSDPNREQIRVYMNSIWDHVVGEISESRNIPVDVLNDYADRLDMWKTTAAVDNGLLDASIYKDQVMDTLACLLNQCGNTDIRSVSYDDYLRVPKRSGGYSKDKIAVIYASGDIVMGAGPDGSIGSESMSKAIREARKDSTVKAIVFRVNSGGGSALASEVIWRELELARKVKPVIASMGDVSASGGYYILTQADTVLASPVTITGSIGVFGLTVNAEDFLNNKLGIHVDVERTNDYSDFGSIYRPLAPREKEVLQHFVDEVYDTFVMRVADGRKLLFQEVDAIGQGRVWSGSNALDLHLVDMMGGLSDAIDIAADKAGLENYRIVELPEVEDPFTRLMNEFKTGIREKLLTNALKENYNRLKSLEEVLGNDRIQARMPFTVKVD